MGFLILLYRLFSILLFPFFTLYIFLRLAKKKEDKNRLQERFGIATKTPSQGRLFWIHAVSVGEANSAMILVSELLKFSPNISILFTTTTLTSAEIIAAKLPQFGGRVIHQFLPLDSYFCVKNFLDYWRPRTVIFVESEIWPNFIFEARRRAITAFLVNGRISEKTFKKWLLAKKIGFKIFDYFTAIFAQTKEDQERFSKISNQEILFYGNLKSQAESLAGNETELEKLKTQIGARKFWLAASTHKGEEEAVIAAHNNLKKDFPDLLTILVPRHPVRAEEIKNLFGPINFVQRSKNQSITNATEIYLADSLGELGIFYRLAPFAFIGGSLVEVGGHNPFEAIKLGCAVISGRAVFNFKEIYKNLEQKNACVMIDSAEQLAKNLKEFLNDKNQAEAMSSNAATIIENSDNIAKKIISKIDQILMINV